MSQNLTTVTAIYEAFGKGDIPTILEHMAPDVQWESWADNSAQHAGDGPQGKRRTRESVRSPLRLHLTQT